VVGPLRISVRVQETLVVAGEVPVPLSVVVSVRLVIASMVVAPLGVTVLDVVTVRFSAPYVSVTAVVDWSRNGD